MTPTPNDDTPDENENETQNTPENRVDSDHGLLAPLRRLLETLADIEDEGGTRRGTGRETRGPATIDYEYDVTIGIGNNEPDSDDNGYPADRRTIRVPTESGSREYHVEIRETKKGPGVVVIADLPGVAEEAIDIFLNEDTGVLELIANDEPIQEIPLEWPAVTITDVSFNNQILEVHLEPDESDLQ